MPGFLMLHVQQSQDILTVGAVFSELDFKVIFSKDVNCLVTPEEECTKESMTYNFLAQCLYCSMSSNTSKLGSPDRSSKKSEPDFLL